MSRKRVGLFVAVLVVAVLGVVYGYRSDKRTREQETASTFPSPPAYVGAKRCAGCHTQATEAWRTSHHAQAMQPANASTVHGNFRDARFTKDQVISGFYQKADKFYVRTDGPDGKLAHYPVAYTFGVFPPHVQLLSACALDRVVADIATGGRDTGSGARGFQYV
jgi:cytochrome c554/c'-like protein